MLKTLLVGFAVCAIQTGFADSGPLAHWRFDESAGTTAVDSAGGYDGKLSAQGAGFVSGGVSGNALQLSRASGGYVDVGDVLGLTSSDFTIISWIKTMPGDTTQDLYVVSKQTPGSSNGYLLALNQSGLYGAAGKMWLYDSANPGGEVVSQTLVNDGNWHQVVGVYHRGATKAIYVDGAPAEASNASKAIVANSASLRIGGPGGALFDGWIDELQVYGRALSDTEIDFLFANPGAEAGLTTGPLAHWKFDETSGTTATDATGVNPGTLSSTGASFVPGGISGNALNLSRAANGYVSMGNVLPLQNTDFSLVAWVKTSPGYTVDDTFVVSRITAGSDNGYYLNVNRSGGGGIFGQTGKALFFAGQSSNSPHSTTTVNDGNWHQIVATYAVGGVKSIYADGSPAEASATAQAVAGNTAKFLVGGVTVGSQPTGLFDGWIDELQVYSRTLSDAEIDYLFAHPGEEVGSQPMPPVVLISPNGGEFTNSVTITLTTTASLATIIYTTDGSAPAQGNGFTYTAPFALTQSATVQARAFTNGVAATEIAAANFTRAPEVRFDPPAGLFTNSQDVALSTYITPADIRYTLDGSTPTASSPLYMQPVHLTVETTIRAGVFFNGVLVSSVYPALYQRVYAIEDGIPASWREQYFGAGYRTDPRVAADADPDHDGSTNLQEYIAGSNPMDPLSGFALGVRAVPLITWASVANTHYKVLRKARLQDADWTTVTEVVASSDQSSYVDTTGDATAFYVVQPVTP